MSSAAGSDIAHNRDPGAHVAGVRSRRFSGASSLLSRIVSPRGCCLTFHRVAPRAQWRGLLDRGFTIELERIDAILTWLQRGGWDVVTLDEALDRAGNRRPFVTFSIDDAYRDTFELLVPLFLKHGLPVTVYVTSGIPDRGHTLWQAGLETVLLESDTVAMPDGRGRIALPGIAEKRGLLRHLHRQWDADGAARHYNAFCLANDYDPAALHERHAISWDMLRQMADQPGVEIGAHTLTHPRLSTLPAEAALAEMAGSRTRLEAMLPIRVRHFAFPFGRRGDCGPREFDLARQAGFASAATTRKGLLDPANVGDPFALPRNTLNGLRSGDAAMAMSLTGLGGFIAKLLGRD